MRSLVRLFAATGVLIVLTPTAALAQNVPLLSVSTPTQPQAATALPSQTVPAVAIAVTAGSAPVTITALDVAETGSAAAGAVTGLVVNENATTTLGTATSAGASTKIPVSLTLQAGESEVLLVSVETASNLKNYQGQFLELNITGVETTAVVSGTLPVYGTQLALSTGVAKPTCSLSANPSVYGVGQTVDLVWQSTNATGGSITGLGSVGPQGLQGILPSGSGVYTGTFNGPGGTGTCQTAVTFNPGASVGVTGTISGSNTGGTSALPLPTTPPVTPKSSGIVPCGNTNGDTPGTAQYVTDSTSCRPCDVASLAQNIINGLIGLSIPLAAAMFAWAGILYFTSAANPTGIERARKVFKMVLWGFLIAICAWLIVQTLLKVILTPQEYQSWNTIQCAATPRTGTTSTDVNQGGTSYNVAQWLSSILGTLNTTPPISIGTNSTGISGTGVTATDNVLLQDALQGACDDGDAASCTSLNSSHPTLTDAAANSLEDFCGQGDDSSCTALNDLYGGTSSGATGARGAAQCADGNTNCSISYLQSLGLSNAQANTMSCIAMTENSGQAVGCSGTGPCGTFQISQTNWNTYAPASCSAANFGSITAAQNNASCNAQTMVAMVQANGYQPWTGSNNGVAWNTAASTCVANYASN